jgi:hypothetical protein
MDMDNIQKNGNPKPIIPNPPEIPIDEFTEDSINYNIVKIDKYIEIQTDGDVDENNAYKADLQDLQVNQPSVVNADNNESKIDELKSFKHMVKFKRLLINGSIDDINNINEYLLSLSDYINKAINYLETERYKISQELINITKDKTPEQIQQELNNKGITKTIEDFKNLGFHSMRRMFKTINDLTKIKTDVDNLIKGIELVNNTERSAETASQFPNLSKLIEKRSANTAGGAVALKVKRIKRKTRRSTKSRRKSFHKKTNRRRDSRR